MQLLFGAVGRRCAKCGDLAGSLFPRPRRNEYHESVPPDPLPARIGRLQAAGLLLLSVALLAAGIGVFRAYAPSVDLVHLQWAGSATVANKIVHQTAYGQYRMALYYDLAALIPGFTFGLIVADYLGWRVFWTHPMRAAAVAGIWAAAVAGLCNVAQDAVLLIVLRHQPMQGVWPFRAAARCLSSSSPCFS
jgi:hypothetical protein